MLNVLITLAILILICYWYLNKVPEFFTEQNYQLRDYYIKTAYNCCIDASDVGSEYTQAFKKILFKKTISKSLENAHVKLQNLDRCLNDNYRGLHFEIFPDSIDDIPHVISSIEGIPVTTGNVILKDAFSKILSFSTKDPIFIILKVNKGSEAYITKIIQCIAMFNNKRLSTTGTGIDSVKLNDLTNAMYNTVFFITNTPAVDMGPNLSSHFDITDINIFDNSHLPNNTAMIKETSLNNLVMAVPHISSTISQPIFNNQTDTVNNITNIGFKNLGVNFIANQIGIPHQEIFNNEAFLLKPTHLRIPLPKAPVPEQLVFVGNYTDLYGTAFPQELNIGNCDTDPRICCATQALSHITNPKYFSVQEKSGETLCYIGSDFNDSTRFGENPSLTRLGAENINSIYSTKLYSLI
jgi:hypothetical protein